MATLAELRSQARQALLELALTSNVRGQVILPAVSHSAPSSTPPSGGEHPAVAVALELERAASRAELERVLERIRDEHGAIVRRDLAPTLSADTVVELDELILERGHGYTPQELAVALRCTPTMVRRARLTHGLDAEHGKPVEVNGNAASLGLELIRAGLSVRAASMLCGIARSTLSDRARRATL